MVRVDDFDFDLPDENIALKPARPRDASRLLVVGEKFEDKVFHELPSLLQAGDLLVVNTTKVLPAALTGKRAARLEDGQPIEVDINLHKNLSPDEAAPQRWAAFARPAKRLRQGDVVSFGDGALTATISERHEAEVVLEFAHDRAGFEQLLARAGMPPLPPYIGRKRAVDAEDSSDYQTMFADEAGSVAAPTAGLHFTPAVMAALKAKGVTSAEVTLHVGAGTFLPVSVEDTKDHKMHAEWGCVSEAVARQINATKARGGKIIAVGTTSLRLLESASASGECQAFVDETDIFITPGYQFRIVDGLITNFHLPRSTLFMLVCALSGIQRMRAAYAHAIEQNYRFYSYGDACYLTRHES